MVLTGSEDLEIGLEAGGSGDGLTAERLRIVRIAGGTVEGDVQVRQPDVIQATFDGEGPVLVESAMHDVAPVSACVSSSNAPRKAWLIDNLRVCSRESQRTALLSLWGTSLRPPGEETSARLWSARE